VAAIQRSTTIPSVGDRVAEDRRRGRWHRVVGGGAGARDPGVALNRIMDSIRSVRSARDVVSITRLESEAAELVRQVSEDGRTLVVTQNGAARVVVMDVVEYDRMQDALALLKMIAQAEADVTAGETASIDEAFAHALDAIDG
jgi:prevent-host-death family protein